MCRSPGRGAVGNRKRKAVGGSPGGSYSTDSKSTGSYTTTGSDTDSKSPRRRNGGHILPFLEKLPLVAAYGILFEDFGNLLLWPGQ